MTHDELPFSAAAHRNRGPILEILQRLLPPSATVLEIASGTGQHGAHFAAAHPAWQWQPTDADEASLAGIAGRCAQLSNVRRPMRLDVLAFPWPVAPAAFDAVYCANMLHIAPWATCPALMRGTAHHLAAGGLLVLYGPYFVEGEPAAPSNIAFDADLRARDPDWGLRSLADVVDHAEAAGMALEERIDMPANNMILSFRRAARGIARGSRKA